MLFEKIFNSSNTLEIEVEFEWQNNSASECGFEFFHNEKGKNIVGYNCKKNELFINREKSGLTDLESGFLQTHFVALSLKNNSILMHIFLDGCSVEVFANNGQVILTDLVFPTTKNYAHSLYIKNGPVILKNLKIWQLTSIWTRGAL